MMDDASTDSINFVAFITMFGKRMQGMDPEDVIKNAFFCLDDNNTGILEVEHLRELLTTIGNKFTEDEVRFIEIIAVI